VITEESQVEQVEMLTQHSDGSIGINTQTVENEMCDSACANLITPPRIYIQTPFLGGGDQDLSQGVSEHSLLGDNAAAAAAAVSLEPQKLPLIQPQQAIQPGGEVASYIDTKLSSPPIVEEVSQGVCQPTEAIALQPDPVAELIEAFPYCDSPQTFAAVTEQYSCEAIEEAIALLSQPERSRLQPMWETLTGVRFLQSVTQWSQVTLSQSRLDEAWQLLDATEQNRLHALCQSAQQSVERQWGVTRKQVETGGAFEWVRGGLVRIVYAAADFVRLATGEFVGYHELRLLQ
jgi:hypothetical protein